MDTDYELLTEKDAMWAEMLIQVLEDHHIPYTSMPTCGAVMAIRGGIQERLKIYVPRQDMPKAQELYSELFPSENP